MRVLATRDHGRTLERLAIPDELQARVPPERRGIRRDEVSLMVSSGSGVRHRRFVDLGEELSPGDLLVVNDSKTLPAAVDLDERTVIHFSTELPGGLHVVELRRRSGWGSEPMAGVEPYAIDLFGGARLEILAPYPVTSTSGRLWAAHLDGVERGDLLSRHGRPITYRHAEPAPIDAYQTVFSHRPGSAEMPSAARPFSMRLVTSLVSRGVAVAPLTLHTGVSSLESGEEPYPEWYDVPTATAALVNHVRERGGCVIAVGTTVVRALETVTDDNRFAHPGRGWTDLVIGPDYEIRGIDGLMTGWHEPSSTHLHMLEAVAGRDAVEESYHTAVENGYLWHEFGDSHLILA